MANTFYVSLAEHIGKLFPPGLLEPPPLPDLAGAWLEPLNASLDPTIHADAVLLLERPLVFGIPGLGGTSLVLGKEGAPSIFASALETAPEPMLRLKDAPLALRFSPDLLRPARRPAGQPNGIEADPTRPIVEIRFDAVTLSIDFDGNLELGDAVLNVPLCLIGETGVGLEAQNVQFAGSMSAPPPGRPAGWRGLFMQSAKLYLPGEIGAVVGQLSLLNASIGNGGFSGTVTEVRNPPDQGKLLGMEFKLEKVSLAFVQNSLAASALTGQIKIPFFEEWVAVEAGLGLDGSVHLKLGGGLPTLRKQGVLEIRLESLGFDLSGGKLAVTLSGKLTPLVAGLSWPTFDLRELTIDSEGNVHLAGGWLDLGNQFSLDFHGFAIEITKLGFGRNPDGSRWIGFSGGINLVAGLPAGAAVDGLRVTWRDGSGISMSLEGVSVELEVPGAFSFKGKVSYREPQPGEHRFDGAIKLKLLALQIDVDGLLVVGRRDGMNYFAIYIGVELPAGIPLGPTGVGLYGMAGLFAYEMGPNKGPAEGWYQNPDGGAGWYLRPAAGVTDLASKWDAQSGGLAFGAGLTIGTLPDNGFSFSGRVLLAIVFPGPVLLIEGRANILKERSRLSEEPLFRALAVLDGNAGTFTFGLSAHYQHLVDGELIDLSGNAEVFFNFNDPGAWHVWIGRKDPRSQRISADIFFRMFGANAYFMLDARSLQLGAWVGYDRHFEFGPLALDLEAWIEGNAALTIKPLHFHGDLWLHGRWAASAFGFGIGMSVDARLAADVFRPFFIKGSFDVTLELPWPLPDISQGIELSWGNENGPRPPLPLPLKEVTVEHKKSEARWPLPRGGAAPLLIPNYDNGGMIADAPPAFDANAGPPALQAIPVIPLDAKVSVTFGRHVNDDAGIAAPSLPEVIEQIGDPDKKQGPLTVRYGLQSAELQRWNGAAWQVVAARPAPAGVKPLYGQWAPMPAGAQTKLQVWSKSAFDYTRSADQAWNGLALKDWPSYPCQTPPPAATVCFDWSWAAVGATLAMPWQHPADPGLRLDWATGDPAPVFRITVWGGSVLQLPVVNESGALEIALPWPADRVEAVIVTDQGGSEWGRLTAFDADGSAFRAQGDGGQGLRAVRLVVEPGGGRDLVRVRLEWQNNPIYFVRLCLREGRRLEREDEYTQKNKLLQGELARWSAEDEVLEPETIFRLKIVTTAEAKAPAAPARVQTEYALFRTQGPPGLAALSVPVTHPDRTPFASGLDDLTRYVEQTLPVTVSRPGQRPRLPRPVYRAYDVGLRFNANYVEMMYRMDGRDLGLYLFDSNNRPARDANGRLLALSNPWGQAEDALLTAGDLEWLKKIQQSNCATIDVSKIARDRVMLASDGHLLAADAPYEARLVPLLFHDSFATGLGGWQAATLGGAAANWTGAFHPRLQGAGALIIGIQASQAVVQLDAGVDLSKIVAGDDVIRLWDDKVRASKRYRIVSLNAGTGRVTVDGWPNFPAGKSTWEIPAYGGAHQNIASDAVLLRGDAGWTDYRFTSFVRLNGGGRAGIVVRWRDAANHARLTISSMSVRFERFVGGAVQEINRTELGVTGDRLLTIEAIGPVLRAYVDGDLRGEFREPALAAGRVGLYTQLPTPANTRFSDARLDDLRPNAPVVYRFSFTTSRFANFYHHLHSYDDSVFTRDFAAAGWQPRAVALAMGDPGEAESRAYRELAEAALGSAANQDPPAVRVTRLGANGAANALLVQSPEPVEWSRTALAVLAAPPAGLKPLPPQQVKLAEVRFGAAQPNEEIITLLAQNAVDLSSARIEYRWLPGQPAAPADPVLRTDDFRQDAAEEDVETVLWQPAFNDLSEVAIRTEAQVLGGAPQWSAQAGELKQSAGTWVRRPRLLAPAPDFNRPATWVQAGETTWSDVRIAVRLSAPAGGGVGVLFRMDVLGNFYYLVLEATPGAVATGRLVRSSGGTRTVLWTGALPNSLDAPRTLVIDAQGAVLRAEFEGMQLFSLTDPTLTAGRVGFGTNRAAGATFADARVTKVARRLGGWAIADETGASGPSDWAVVDGALRQRSAIGAAAAGNPGTYMVAGDAGWIDYRFEAFLRSDAPGAVGLIVRYADARNYYRFSVDDAGGYRRLVSVTNGAAATVWESLGPNAYPQGTAFRLAVEVIGPHLVGLIDGVSVFVVRDAGHAAGKVGIYCSVNPGLLVFEDEVRFIKPQWQAYHAFGAGEKLAPGGRLRLFAGNAAQAPIPQTGAVDRFVAQGADAGRLRLPPEGVDLQVLLPPADPVTAAMPVSHRRRFRPDSAYAPVDARILRKADGGAWALFPAAGSLAPGEYRLRFTFNRDNQAVAKGSPVYSQAGDRSDEVVTIDVPWEE